MGSAASTPPSNLRASTFDSPCTKAIKEELSVQFCCLEQSCEQVRLTSEETYRLLSSRYQDYCESNNKLRYNFEDQSIPLPFRVIIKKMNSSELIQAIIRSENPNNGLECICFACNAKFENNALLQEHKNYLKTTGGHNIVEPADSLIIQSRFNTNTVSGDVASVSRNWKETVSRSSREYHKEITKSLCFIPNEVKVLFQGKKVFHRSCNESVVVHVCVYFHTEACCIEIVPHIVEIIDFSSCFTSTSELTDNCDSLPSVESDKAWEVSGPNLSGKPSRLTIDTTFADKKLNATATGPSTDLFIPLPRIYLDYNTLLGTVREQPNYFGSDSLEHHILSQDVSASQRNVYIPREERRSVAVDVCMDRMVVHYVTSHLELPPISPEKTHSIRQTLAKSLSFGALSPMKAFGTPKSITEIKSPTFHSPEARVSTTLASTTVAAEETVRANLSNYTLRFDDSGCGISPVFAAPLTLVPVPAVCSEPIYVYCHDAKSKLF